MDSRYLRAAQASFDEAERMEPGSKEQESALRDAEGNLKIALGMYDTFKAADLIRYVATRNL